MKVNLEWCYEYCTCSSWHVFYWSKGTFWMEGFAIDESMRKVGENESFLLFLGASSQEEQADNVREVGGARRRQRNALSRMRRAHNDDDEEEEDDYEGDTEWSYCSLFGRRFSLASLIHFFPFLSPSDACHAG